MRRQAAVWSVPDHLLCEAFSLVELHERAGVLPLVCKKFHELLGTGSAAWGELEWVLQLQSEEAIGRCHAFLAWLQPRAGLTRILSLKVERSAVAPDLDLPAAAHSGLRDVLAAARLSLTCLKLVLVSTLDLGSWAPMEMPQLASLYLATLELRLGAFLQGLPRLRQLDACSARDVPPALTEGSQLPEGLTRLVMVPGPPRIPACMLQLRQLKYLDIGGGYFERGALDAALPHFTGLEILALDRSALLHLPRQLSRLTNLRILSMLQALEGEGIDRASFSVLSCLTALSTLSISGCWLYDTPPGVVQLTTLQVLHTEGALRAMVPGPYLRSLRLLSVDWQVLFWDPTMLLEQAACLRRLCVCLSNFGSIAPWEYANLRGSAEVLSAVAAHPTLQSVVVVVSEHEVAPSSVRLTELLVALARCRPNLDVRVVPAAEFFLTDGIGSGQGL